jgi:hypothetical protein
MHYKCWKCALPPPAGRAKRVDAGCYRVVNTPHYPQKAKAADSSIQRRLWPFSNGECTVCLRCDCHSYLNEVYEIWVTHAGSYLVDWRSDFSRAHSERLSHSGTHSRCVQWRPRCYSRSKPDICTALFVQFGVVLMYIRMVAASFRKNALRTGSGWSGMAQCDFVAEQAQIITKVILEKQSLRQLECKCCVGSYKALSSSTSLGK